MWPFSSSSASPSATPSSSSIQTSSSYSSTLSPSTTPATSSVPPASTPTQAPDRHQRTLCWESRDAYFACLNTHNVLIAGTEGEGCVCEVERGEYGVHCGKSWVGHPSRFGGSSTSEITSTSSSTSLVRSYSPILRHGIGIIQLSTLLIK